MKRTKKFAALMLAVVMAFTLLTGCGAIGGSTGDLKLSTVKSLVKEAGGDASIGGDNLLQVGMQMTASIVAEGGVTNADQVLQIVSSVAAPYEWISTYWILESSLQAGEMTVDGVNVLGTLDTPEKLAAAGVLYYEAQNKDYTYDVCGIKCTNPQGAAVWIIAVVAK